MKAVCKKISAGLRWVFGYGVMLCLFAGGFTFFGFLAALFIGGETATEICVFIHKTLFPYIIKITTVMVLLGLLVMYLNGEVALVSSAPKNGNKAAEEKAGLGEILISIIVPLVGIALWLIRRKSTPKAAKSYAKVGIVAGVVDLCITLVLYAVL